MKLNRAEALRALGAGVAAWSWPGPLRAAGRTPNVLWIFADDQSYRSLGCYRYRPWAWVQTPNIDRLAAEGVRFERAYCGAWCIPSRASLLTGLHVHAIEGMRQADKPFDPEAYRFWPAALRRAGYETACIGKWHIRGYDELDLWNRDWDHWIGWVHGDVKTGGYYGEPGNPQRLSINGRRQWVEGYSTDNYTQYAVEYVRREHRRPWFLWLCHGASHAPYIPAERHRDRYQDAPVPIPPGVFGPRQGKPALMRDFTMFQPGARPGDPPFYATEGYPRRSLPEFVRAQNRTVCAIDEGVGRLLDALGDTGQLDNTMIVYSSDNGFPWGEHGFANKNGPYDACARTPLIVRWPAEFPRGAVCRHPVSQLDLVPTLLALAKATSPWPMHGHDLLPLLKRPSASWPHAVLIEYFDETFGSETARWTQRAARRPRPWDPPAWWITFHQGAYRYIRWLAEDEIEELYNLDNDPQELHNLAIDRRHHPLLRDYRARMENLLRRTNGRIVDSLPRPRIVPA